MAESEIRRSWGQTRVDLVQAILLLSLRQTGRGDKQSAFWYAGQACTMALSLGLNRASTTIGDADPVSSSYR